MENGWLRGFSQPFSVFWTAGIVGLQGPGFIAAQLLEDRSTAVESDVQGVAECTRSAIWI